MEEKEKNTKKELTFGLGIMLGAYILGYAVGRAEGNKFAANEYSRGVMDTFQAIILKQK